MRLHPGRGGALPLLGRCHTLGLWREPTSSGFVGAVGGAVSQGLPGEPQLTAGTGVSLPCSSNHTGGTETQA